MKHGNVRENAIEILKLRGAAHQKKIVAFQITNQGWLYIRIRKYSVKLNNKEVKMKFNREMYLKEVGGLFLIIGILHLWRAISGWSLFISTWSVPIWASYVVGIFILIMSWKAFHFAKSK